MSAALSPTSSNSSPNSSLSNCDHQINDEKIISIDNNNNATIFQQPAFIHSFETELDKVDEYFQTKASDVRQTILNSLQRMYNQNEWHDNPLSIICRDLGVHVPTPEQLMELRATRDALKAEYDALRQSDNN
ncbi:unnamed protein product [Rotaria socialis]|uniref:Uncharacterized protein n=3 Tax=Rotaria socialis TaxID=392032 RepID=A0A817XRE2_9BILA|nr:unnamed protein product [Rotaria socialis]CAF3318045.1 unnamed protein product [Rotaria socialis]CAF3369636.1 unnamed protein product [Rotaria socialis]CAF3504080.1 unnamed protein product [Rotaria socialis]CAF3755035.1 unnamed protein product [Rotaria socialis]